MAQASHPLSPELKTPNLTYTELHGHTPNSPPDGLLLRLKRAIKLAGPREDIHFHCRRTEQDLHEEAQSRTNSLDWTSISDRYFISVENLLHSIGIRQAEADFLRDQDGKIVRGSTRTPLLIRTPQERFIIKPYDNYNPARERSILEVVSGKMAPAVKSFGSEVYAEEYIDSKETPSLFERSRGLEDRCSTMEQVVLDCAAIYANLARLGVNYNHNHCITEFRVSKDGRQVVTDFGTSIFFYDEGWFDEKHIGNSQKKFDAILAEREAIPYKGNEETYDKVQLRLGFQCEDLQLRRRLVRHLEELTKTTPANFLETERLGEKSLTDVSPYTLVNLKLIIDSAHDALHNFFEHRPEGAKRGRVSGWDLLAPYKPAFNQTFLDTYLR